MNGYIEIKETEIALYVKLILIQIGYMNHLIKVMIGILLFYLVLN
jgi:hypothetical protein